MLRRKLQVIGKAVQARLLGPSFGQKLDGSSNDGIVARPLASTGGYCLGNDRRFVPHRGLQDCRSLAANLGAYANPDDPFLDLELGGPVFAGKNELPGQRFGKLPSLVVSEEAAERQFASMRSQA